MLHLTLGLLSNFFQLADKQLVVECLENFAMLGAPTKQYAPAFFPTNHHFAEIGLLCSLGSVKRTERGKI